MPHALQFICETHVELPAQPPADGGALVLFAHFDPHGLVDPYVTYYLESLKRLGATIVFVSGSPHLRPESVDAIRALCAGIYTRETLSMDFGSWHLAWNILVERGWSLNQFDRFVLANDSVYGPLFPIDEMWTSFTDADMYGAIESLECSPHLQSFFLAWDLNARTRPFLQSFWDQFQYVTSKSSLIRKCEVGLSRRARMAGLTIKPYVSAADIRVTYPLAADHQWAAAFASPDVNNALYYWDGLIEHLRFPFLKTNLPRGWRPRTQEMNGARKALERFVDCVPIHESMGDLCHFIEQRTAYPYDLIAANLERLGCRPLDGSARR